MGRAGVPQKTTPLPRITFFVGMPLWRSEDRAGFDADVIGYANLASHDYVVFDGGAAGEAGLRGDDDILADLDVVADVDQVVDFCAAADAGFVQRSAVDGGVGADFYVVFDDQASDLRGLLVASGCESRT